MPETEVKEADELEAALKASEETGSSSGDEGKTAEELAAEEEAKKAADETVTIKKSDYERDQKRLDDLRTLTLQQKRDQATLQATVGRLQRNQETLAKSNVMSIKADDEAELGEEVEEVKKPAVELEKPTAVEKLEADLKELGQTNAAQYEMLLDMMSDTQKYADVNEVCSDAHFADIVHAVATQISEDQGIDYNEAALKTEIHIWSQPNPYKYMYGLIKEHHPDYTSEKGTPGEGDTGKDEGKGKPDAGDKGKIPPKTPKSIASVEGSHDTSSGWTSKRIDDMDEDELDKVPPDIYDKYMAGELD